MNKILVLAALLVASLVPSVHADSIVRGKSMRFEIPTGANGSGPDSEAKWSLPSIARVEFKTTATNPVDGELLIKSICATSTSTTAGYVAIYDTLDPTSVTLGSNAFGSFVAAVMARIIVNTWDTPKPSCEFFPRGLPISYGLVILNSDANMRTTVTYDLLRQ